MFNLIYLGFIHVSDFISRSVRETWSSVKYDEKKKNYLTYGYI